MDEEKSGCALRRDDEARDKGTPMFEQTFVDGKRKTKRPATIFLSLLLQCVAIGVSDLDSADLHRSSCRPRS